ncbi:MAG: phosphoesterase [Acidobacteria bacterium]|nr:MAG: phosphoesterase [Acidobacteriota bacterium]REK04515.1 MAG: phosphoesterase [Acidobacteriota bacterium]
MTFDSSSSHRREGSSLFARFALGLILLTVPATQATAESVATRWNALMLDAIAANPPAPTLVTWRMHLVSSAMYDAWACYDEVALGTRYGGLLRRPAVEHTEANKERAVSHAAFRALSYVYPNQVDWYEDLMEDLGYALSDSRDPRTPEGIGNLMADAAVASRADDGANASGGFAQITSPTFPTLYAPVNGAEAGSANAPGGVDFDPNRWQPLRVPNGTQTDANGDPIVVPDDPSSYNDQSFLSPHWGAVRPFALTSGSQFLPPAPPQKNSQAEYVDALGNTSTNHDAWVTQMDEIRERNANLTDEEKILAEFWADGPRTWTPPGHWNQFAEGLSIRDNHDVGQDVRMFFALNAGLHDAAIASWDAKRRYDFIRPISAIQDHYFGQPIQGWGGPDQGTQTILGQEWQPYQSLTFVTPPFGEYVSGHSTFSRTSREILMAFTGSDALYDGVTRLNEDYDGDGELDLLGQHVAEPGSLMFEDGPDQTITLRWFTMLEASDSAGESRRHGGIHFQDGDLWGREMGRQIGQQAYALAEAFWTGDAAAGVEAGGSVCVPDSTTLCIDGRFRVQTTFATTLGEEDQAGLGNAVSLDAVGVGSGGLFWFFTEDNPEVVVKVLDGCAINQHYWVLVAAATNVGYSLSVFDTDSGSSWNTQNPDGTLAPANIDTFALPCAP